MPGSHLQISKFTAAGIMVDSSLSSIVQYNVISYIIYLRNYVTVYVAIIGNKIAKYISHGVKSHLHSCDVRSRPIIDTSSPAL